MDPKIQKKLDEYKKLVTTHFKSTSSGVSQPDSLRQLIRSKKDADDFMAELENAIRRSN
ncbi:hypothetical protein [Pedobacter nyackensis]|uniref:hypothetical protein n=1 Tax=Pedobacter nyackensis TaxID=475255 RepID=UPI0029304058|nr:hypothetical protein [Pedobacter nyackensis]